MVSADSRAKLIPIMSQQGFVTAMEEAILSLPQDMKVLLRVVEDLEVDDEGRILVAGALIHAISGSNAIPGMRGTLAFMDDALILRLVAKTVSEKNAEAMKEHRASSPEFATMDAQLEVARGYIGDLFPTLEKVIAGLPKINHQGHTAAKCISDDEGTTWLYDAVHEAIVEQFDFEEGDVARELKRIDPVLARVRTSLAQKV